jgi:hypothetical protein
MSNKETLLQTVLSEPDFQDADSYVIIGIKGNKVWQSTQGNPMHLMEVLKDVHDHIKKDLLKQMVKGLSEILQNEEEPDDPIKMELAKNEAIKAIKNITKH